MGFFATFNVWLNVILNGYIGTHTAQMAGLLEPVIVVLGTLYVMIWGYLHILGRLDEPFVAGLKRIIVLSVVLGAALHLWLYNTVIVDSFFNAPGQLSAALIGAWDPVAIVDQIILAGGDAANLLLAKGGLFGGNLAFYLAGFATYLIVGITAIYTAFLLTLSRIALSVLLAIGPLFIGLVLFQTTKKFFEAWIAQLANYAMVTILTVLVAALMMGIVTTAAQQAAGQGGSITIADAVRVCMAAGLTLLIMRQVMPMAAALASGLALSSFGLVSAVVGWGFGGATRNSGDFLRGLMLDRETTRWDSLSRRAGYYLGHAGGAGVRKLAGGWRENSIREARK